MNGLFIGIVIVIFIVIVIYSIISAAKRRKELAAWAGLKGLNYTNTKDYGMDDKYSQFGVLRKGERRYAYNIMSGNWDDLSITAFDYHYETHSRDSKGRRQTHHHHFSSVILKSDIPLKPLFIRPEGFFDKITEFFGFDDIDFESAEFSKKFFVKAGDRKWAYDVIHTRTMQYLLDNPTFTIQFDDNSNIIAYRNKKFKVEEFETAADLIKGLLDLMPGYLVKQQKEGFS